MSVKMCSVVEIKTPNEIYIHYLGQHYFHEEDQSVKNIQLIRIKDNLGDNRSEEELCMDKVNITHIKNDDDHIDDDDSDDDDSDDEEKYKRDEEQTSDRGSSMGSSSPDNPDDVTVLAIDGSGVQTCDNSTQVDMGGVRVGGKEIREKGNKYIKQQFLLPL